MRSYELNSNCAGKIGIGGKLVQRPEKQIFLTEGQGEQLCEKPIEHQNLWIIQGLYSWRGGEFKGTVS